MMSEKRFVLDKLEKGNAILSVRITDNVTDDNYFIMTKESYEDDIDEIVECLNEQQSTIQELERKLKKYSKIGEEQLKQIMELQDLCGQSDYENAKLRQEIKELKAQLREKEEDERLYANEIVKLNKEAKEVLDFKSLGGDY